MPRNHYVLCDHAPDDPDSPSPEDGKKDPFFSHGILGEEDEDPEEEKE